MEQYNEIILWPDEILLSECRRVESVGQDENLVISGMLSVMKKEKGVAIAAPQVGSPKRIIAINMNAIDEAIDEDLVMINPEIIDGIGEIVVEEGCLSLPDVLVPMLRSKIAIVEYEDISGEKKSLTADGILSIAIQHEVDHLDGRLIVENLNRDKRRKVMKNLLKKKNKK